MAVAPYALLVAGRHVSRRWSLRRRERDGIGRARWHRNGRSSRRQRWRRSVASSGRTDLARGPLSTTSREQKPSQKTKQQRSRLVPREGSLEVQTEGRPRNMARDSARGLDFAKSHCAPWPRSTSRFSSSPSALAARRAPTPVFRPPPARQAVPMSSTLHRTTPLPPVPLPAKARGATQKVTGRSTSPCR